MTFETAHELFDTYRITVEQRRLRRVCAYAHTCQSLPCSGAIFDVDNISPLDMALKKTATLKSSESDMQTLIKPCNLPQTLSESDDK